ncbi:MAG TPA: RNA polymerase sigma factor [Sandaracinaceae bacterium]
MHEGSRPPSPEAAALASALVARQPEFAAFVERRLGDRALAEDVLQDAFVRALDKLGDLRDPAAAVAWFYRVLRNAVVDRKRRAAARARALEAFAAELTVVADGTETEREVCRCVLRLVDELRPEHAAALRRIAIDEVAVKDFATEAGITRNNAGVRVHRARAALKARVEATCGACAARGCDECTCGAP